MQNLKYHALNMVSIIVFSYLCASAVNHVIRSGFSEKAPPRNRTSLSPQEGSRNNPVFDDYSIILSSGFFRDSENETDGNYSGHSDIADMLLLGTITGPPEIARAMIRGKNDKNPGVFRKSSVVHGYILVRIAETAVFLKRDSNVHRLELYDSHGEKSDSKDGEADTKAQSYERDVSRSELKQNVKNITNVFRGLRARPERVEGSISGFKIAHIENSNILYRYGARKGDIIKTVNGKKILSTQDFYNALRSVQDEAMIIVELDRGGKPIRAEFSINE